VRCVITLIPFLDSPSVLGLRHIEVDPAKEQPQRRRDIVTSVKRQHAMHTTV
jgi:hypothetical protein